MEMRPKPSSSSSFRSDNKGEEGILCSANFLNFSRVERRVQEEKLKHHTEVGEEDGRRRKPSLP